jgi:hypothetical protein
MSSRTLIGKAFQHDFYWPTTLTVTIELVKTCCIPVSCQADPHTGADAANDSALMAIRCLGVGHPGAISPGHRRVPVSLCHQRQIHQVVGSDPYGQDQ